MSYKYPMQVLTKALDLGIESGLFKQPDDDVKLSEMLSALDAMLSQTSTLARKLAEDEEHKRLQPIKISQIADLPYPAGEVLFVDMSDNPGRELMYRMFRSELRAKAFCFLGKSPEWVTQLTMTGHIAYEITTREMPEKGCRVLKAYPSSVGIRWWEHTIGEPEVVFN